MESDQQLIEADPIVVAKELDENGHIKSVTLTPGQLKNNVESEQKRRDIIKAFIKKNMEKDVDFGSIDIKGRKSKPSLFKPGAEKFCNLFKIRPVFSKDVDTWEMLGSVPGVLAYICHLYDPNGNVVGEGRGTATAGQGDFDVNKAVKIAEKRAQMDAVLRTGALSDFFTQDVEDMPKDNQTLAREVETVGQKAPMTGEPTAAQLGLIDRLSREKEIDFDVQKPTTKQEASELITKLMELPKKELGNE